MNQNPVSTYVEAGDISFVYYSDENHDRGITALDSVNLKIEKGSHVAILGRNGSGKSTLAKLINALELPSSGVIVVSGFDTRDEEYLWEIRRRTGMVFQNPDNQIVGTTVEEDTAFGPENLGVPQPELRRRVDGALQAVGLYDQARRQPSELSGGQKQKLAIAGILAMQPECIVLDEATAMLDPKTRHEFMRLVHELQAERGLTVINVTHHMDEAIQADYLYILNYGQVVIEGVPSEVFQEANKIRDLGLEVPVPTAVAAELADAFGAILPIGAAEGQSGAEKAIRHLLAEGPAPHRMNDLMKSVVYDRTEPSRRDEPVIIDVKGLYYSYNPGESQEVRALQDLNFEVRKGEVLGIIGSSGSGKSTLIQQLNALLKPQKGTVHIDGLRVGQKENLAAIRARVGLLFQYPEHQLFAESIYEDVAFGPRQQGVEEEEVEQRVYEALTVVGMVEESVERSPFELSGGQMRRVALAGILAMKPQVLILDEPAAGLDPVGKEEILSYILALRDMGVTVVLVSHSMDDVARFADRLLVLHEGKQVAWGEKRAIFSQEEQLKVVNLELPQVTRFLADLSVEIAPELSSKPPAYTIEEGARQLVEVWRKRRVSQHE